MCHRTDCSGSIQSERSDRHPERTAGRIFLWWWRTERAFLPQRQGDSHRKPEQLDRRRSRFPLPFLLVNKRLWNDVVHLQERTV